MKSLIFLALLFILGCTANQSAINCESYCYSQPHIMCVGRWSVSGTYPDCDCNYVCDQSNDLNQLTINEVSAHNNENDCFIIINESVYDITEFLSSHPEEKSMILDNCGQNITNMLLNNSNPKDIVSNLQNYFIAEIK